MNILIITGMSGAGKSTAVRIIEDIGYFCIDNLPPSLIPKFIEICAHSDGKFDKVAIVIDSRSGYFLEDLTNQINYLDNNGFNYKILYLDADDEVLVNRFKESRRIHPLARNSRVTEGISLERKMLLEVRHRANYIINTSNLTPKKLKEHIIEIFEKGEKVEKLVINIFSFGFKYRAPMDADIIFDVRFIPNPFYIESMRNLTGNDEKVKNYVLNQEETKIFLEKFVDMLEFLIPNYINEGKIQLAIGIGCTGGQHRSVVIANYIYEMLKKKGHKVIVDHRDVEKAHKNLS